MNGIRSTHLLVKIHNGDFKNFSRGVRGSNFFFGFLRVLRFLKGSQNALKAPLKPWKEPPKQMLNILWGGGGLAPFWFAHGSIYLITLSSLMFYLHNKAVIRGNYPVAIIYICCLFRLVFGCCALQMLV